MTGRNDVLLTAADLLRWRQEDKEVDEQMRQLMAKRADIKRRLEAAEILAQAFKEPETGSGPVPPSANGHGSEEAEEEAETAPVALLASMRKRGDSLNVQQIRARLIELGFSAKIEAQPNYHYSLASRLKQTGKLIKRGSKYRAVPIVSPEGETEAVGASARH
jgi:hypothetical protein